MEGASAPHSPQTLRFMKQVEERFIKETAAPEAKERAERIVQTTFAPATVGAEKAAESDSIQKMREQLAVQSAADSSKLEEQAKTQGVSQTVMGLLHKRQEI